MNIPLIVISFFIMLTLDSSTMTGLTILFLFQSWLNHQAFSEKVGVKKTYYSDGSVDKEDIREYSAQKEREMVGDAQIYDESIFICFFSAIFFFFEFDNSLSAAFIAFFLTFLFVQFVVSSVSERLQEALVFLFSIPYWVGAWSVLGSVCMLLFSL